MSNRFHSKYHRHNHHTAGNPDPRYPDSGHDPIASPESPFLGDFVMFGGLSATQESLSAAAGSFVNTGLGLAINASGNVNITGSLSASSIEFVGVASSATFTTPITASGDFLLLTVNGAPRAVRLWSY